MFFFREPPPSERQAQSAPRSAARTESGTNSIILQPSEESLQAVYLQRVPIPKQITLAGNRIN